MNVTTAADQDGFWSFANSTSPVTKIGTVLLILSSIWHIFIRSKPFHPQAPPLIKWSIPFVGPYQYFHRSWDFFRTQRAIVLSKPNTSPSNPFEAFSFRVRGNPVVAISGKNSRQWFLTHSKLDLGLGYKELFGGSANPPPEEEYTDSLGTDGFIPRLKVRFNRFMMCPNF